MHLNNRGKSDTTDCMNNSNFSQYTRFVPWLSSICWKKQGFSTRQLRMSSNVHKKRFLALSPFFISFKCPHCEPSYAICPCAYIRRIVKNISHPIQDSPWQWNCLSWKPFSYFLLPVVLPCLKRINFLCTYVFCGKHSMGRKHKYLKSLFNISMFL